MYNSLNPRIPKSSCLTGGASLDTLWAISEILETEDVADRPDAGLLKYAIIARNQREHVVCSFERTILVKRASY
jgi:acyl dehydratase